jgi:hypothetical protein
MDTSFFSHAPKQGATQDPDNRDLKQLVNVNICSAYLNPDYQDHADAYIKEHAKKRSIHAPAPAYQKRHPYPARSLKINKLCFTMTWSC